MSSFRMVSLYTGAGGLDYGFEAAGFETCAAVEIDHDCCETIHDNWPWPVIERAIEKVPSQEILDTAGLRVGEVDLLLGGPPCQPFSKSGYWVEGDSRRLDDPRASTLHAYMRCVKDLLPRVFVLENVHGISYSGKEDGFRLLEQLTDEINHKSGTNYQLSWRVLNAADYGVPQLRQRFFLVAHREGQRFDFDLLSPTHGPVSDAGDLPLGLPSGERAPYVTAWDAIGKMDVSPGEDLRVRGQWADLLPSIPEGENYLWHTHRKGGLPLFGWRTRYWSFLLKLAKDRPSWTIQAQPGPAIGPFHWESRRLSIREMAALQTFPPGITFAGNRYSVQKQLGNAVPSLLAEVIARAVAAQLFGATITGPLQCAVELKRPIPSPEPVWPVPEKYLGLKGDHPDHPGEGLGPLTRPRDRASP